MYYPWLKVFVKVLEGIQDNYTFAQPGIQATIQLSIYHSTRRGSVHKVRIRICGLRNAYNFSKARHFSLKSEKKKEF